MVALLACLAIGYQEITPAQLAERELADCDSHPTTLTTIRTLNAVVALGPDGAKQVIEDYFGRTKSQNKSGLYPLIRCIFEIPRRTGFLPPPKLGDSDPKPPFDLRKSPRFPYTLAGDIPFAVASHKLAPFAEHEANHFFMLEHTASFRTKPLIPVDHPWRLFETSNMVEGIDYSPVISRMHADVLDLVSTAYRPKGYRRSSYSSLTDTIDGWQKTVAEMEAVRMRWDRDKEEYVRSDGSVLPPPTGDR